MDLDFENLLVFSEDYWIDAIIGLNEEYERVVYSYSKLVKLMCENENCSEEEAIDYIEYNTIRSLPYYKNSPIIVYDAEVEDLKDCLYSR